MVAAEYHVGSQFNKAACLIPACMSFGTHIHLYSATVEDVLTMHDYTYFYQCGLKIAAN